MTRAERILLEAGGLETYQVTATVPNAQGSLSLKKSPGFTFNSGLREKVRKEQERRRMLTQTKEIRSE